MAFENLDPSMEQDNWVEFYVKITNLSPTKDTVKYGLKVDQDSNNDHPLEIWVGDLRLSDTVGQLVSILSFCDDNDIVCNALGSENDPSLQFWKIKVKRTSRVSLFYFKSSHFLLFFQPSPSSSSFCLYRMIMNLKMSSWTFSRSVMTERGTRDIPKLCLSL